MLYPFALARWRSCPHLRAVDWIPASSKPTITSRATTDYPTSACLAPERARWCADCSAAIQGPSPSPSEELELLTLAAQVHGLDIAERVTALSVMYARVSRHSAPTRSR